MKSIRFNRQAGSLGVIAAMLVAFIAPTIALAAQVTERSIALSNSSKSATNVSYQVNFTPVANAGAFVVDFCQNSPVIGQTCTPPPTGFSASAAASTTIGFTDVTAAPTKFTVAGTLQAGVPVAVTVNGINNPSEAGPLYARIITYNNKTNALTYESTDLKTGNVDEGGVAISITDTVGVSGMVLESLTFCVAGSAITENCGNATTPGNEPVISIGEDLGDDLVALSASNVSTGSIFTQISTNAVGGAIVNLKSTTPCGGMKRVNAVGCDIAPALQTGILAGEAKFGVRTGPVTDSNAQTSNGTLRPYVGSGYNDTTYALNYSDTNTTGVTSPFGDPILDTDGAPANGKNARLTFGASISNSTPAGAYASNLSLIATGKF